MITSDSFEYEVFEAEDSMDRANEAVAYASMIVASAGDYALLNECGFAIEYAKSDSVPANLEHDHLEGLHKTLSCLTQDSQVLEYWEEQNRADEFRDNIYHLVEQLSRFPDCKKSRFMKLPKKTLVRIIKEAGENFFIGHTLSLSEITDETVIEIGRFRGVQCINFLPCDDRANKHAFDGIIKIALQNWAGSLTAAHFKSIGTMSGTTQFEFPISLTKELKSLRLEFFEASGFVATDEIIASVLSVELGGISLGFNRLTPQVFDKIESQCVNLKYFFISSSFECSTAFTTRAEHFQRNHPFVRVHINGRDLSVK